MKLQRQTPASEHRATLMRSMRSDGVGGVAQAALQAEKAKEKEELAKNDPKVSAEVLVESVDGKLGGAMRRRKNL